MRFLLAAAAAEVTLTDVALIPDGEAEYGSNQHQEIAYCSRAERNQFQLAGPPRELLIQLPDRDDIAVFELQLPVRSLDEQPGR